MDSVIFLWLLRYTLSLPRSAPPAAARDVGTQHNAHHLITFYLFPEILFTASRRFCGFCNDARGVAESFIPSAHTFINMNMQIINFD